MALLVFLVGFIISLGLMIWLATIEGQLTPQQQTLLDAADWLLKTSVGAMFGILLGKRLE